MGAQRHRKNSERDQRIVELRAKGLSVQQLAERFHVSPRDVTQICYRASLRKEPCTP
jgi:DNA-binding NarL/FixJ family response regulator